MTRRKTDDGLRIKVSQRAVSIYYVRVPKKRKAAQRKTVRR